MSKSPRPAPAAPAKVLSYSIVTFEEPLENDLVPGGGYFLAVGQITQGHQVDDVIVFHGATEYPGTPAGPILGFDWAYTFDAVPTLVGLTMRVFYSGNTTDSDAIPIVCSDD